MLVRPKLTDDAIIAKLQSEYDLLAPALEFLPIGNDARAWSFRVETATSEYFLKLRRGTLNVASLIVPHYLLSCGIENVVAPIPANSGRLYALVNDYAFMLYPYIHGESEWDTALTAAQWREWGAIMRSIHDAPLPAELAEDVPREIFAVKWLDKIERVEDVLARGAYDDGVAEVVAGIWRSKSDVIEQARSRLLVIRAAYGEKITRFRSMPRRYPHRQHHH